MNIVKLMKNDLKQNDKIPPGKNGLPTDWPLFFMENILASGECSKETATSFAKLSLYACSACPVIQLSSKF